MPAKYDLGTVHQMLQEWLDGNDQKVWFTPRKKSYGAVSVVFAEDDAVAQETIVAGMMKLNSAGFFQQQYLSGREIVADVYGLEGFRGHNWYVKFYIHTEGFDECIAAISFHPLDEIMKCENGNVLEITYQGVRPWKNV